MKVAAVHWTSDVYKKITDERSLFTAMEKELNKAQQQKVQLIVFPGFLGCLYAQITMEKFSEYLDMVYKFSKEFKVAICPGSYWEKTNNECYHSTSIIKNGKLIVNQRQIYLAKWEQRIGLSRGIKLNTCQLGKFNIGIMISTDNFYPQVGRALAKMGCDLVLSPIGLVGNYNEALQISGVHQKVQQNLFFAIECGFNGNVKGNSFWSSSSIHAPLLMTAEERGYLCKSNSTPQLLTAELVHKDRLKAISNFNVLNHLNTEFYCKMKMFNGGIK
ncbi:carbon-nitrogen hydrolase family protein [Proteinivorax tanatarense]|uniref:Carbon-nitrogen hydrolase family protein n=1 Tax=Proteinivorax tanatarense TaxID=1260629 RepID=A0AAU7VPY9_9FIRM